MDPCINACVVWCLSKQEQFAAAQPDKMRCHVASAPHKDVNTQDL